MNNDKERIERSLLAVMNHFLNGGFAKGHHHLTIFDGLEKRLEVESFLKDVKKGEEAKVGFHAWDKTRIIFKFEAERDASIEDLVDFLDEELRA